MPCLCRQLDHLGQRHLGDEADLLEVGRVDAEEERGIGRDRGLEVAQVRAIGRAHLDQPRAALAHHIGDAEAAADLHQLAARDHHLPALGQRNQRQEHRAGVVVDRQRRLRAGELAQQLLGMEIARAALAGLQVVFQVAVAGRDRVHRRARGRAERRAAQVGVDDDAGRVDHGGRGCRASARPAGAPHPRPMRRVRASPRRPGCGRARRPEPPRAASTASSRPCSAMASRSDSCANRRSTLGSARRRSLWGAVASAIGHLTRKRNQASPSRTWSHSNPQRSIGHPCGRKGTRTPDLLGVNEAL